MDRKSIIALVVCFIVLMLWYPMVVNKLYPPKRLPPGPTNAPPATLTATNQSPAPAPAPAIAEVLSNCRREMVILDIDFPFLLASLNPSPRRS